jgi:hypothetical protein
MTERPIPPDYVTDIQIAEIWGVCDKTARRAIKALERAGGFPRKDPLFGGKRYWPAVDSFMKRRAGLNVPLVPTDGEENWDDKTPAPRRRTRAPVAASR